MNISAPFIHRPVATSLLTVGLALVAKARRNLGAHYTSERNILKVIEPLFLDDLRGQLA